MEKKKLLYLMMTVLFILPLLVQSWKRHGKRASTLGPSNALIIHNHRNYVTPTTHHTNKNDATSISQKYNNHDTQISRNHKNDATPISQNRKKYVTPISLMHKNNVKQIRHNRRKEVSTSNKKKSDRHRQRKGHQNDVAPIKNHNQKNDATLISHNRRKQVSTRNGKVERQNTKVNETAPSIPGPVLPGGRSVSMQFKVVGDFYIRGNDGKCAPSQKATCVNRKCPPITCAQSLFRKKCPVIPLHLCKPTERTCDCDYAKGWYRLNSNTNECVRETDHRCRKYRKLHIPPDCSSMKDSVVACNSNCVEWTITQLFNDQGVNFTNKCKETAKSEYQKCEGDLKCMCMYPFVKDDVSPGMPKCRDRVEAMKLFCDSIKDNREVSCEDGDCNYKYCWNLNPNRCKSDDESLKKCNRLRCQCKKGYSINLNDYAGRIYPDQRGSLSAKAKVCVPDADCIISVPDCSRKPHSSVACDSGCVEYTITQLYKDQGKKSKYICEKTAESEYQKCKGKLKCMCEYPYVKNDVNEWNDGNECLYKVDAMKLFCDSIKDNREVSCEDGNCDYKYCWDPNPNNPCKYNDESLKNCHRLRCQCKTGYYVNLPKYASLIYPYERGSLNAKDKVCVPEADCNIPKPDCSYKPNSVVACDSGCVEWSAKQLYKDQGVNFKNKCTEIAEKEYTKCEGKLECMCMYPLVLDDVTNTPKCIDRIEAMKKLCDWIDDNREVSCEDGGCDYKYCLKRNPENPCKSDIISLQNCNRLRCQCKAGYFVNLTKTARDEYPEEQGSLSENHEVCIPEKSCSQPAPDCSNITGSVVACNKNCVEWTTTQLYKDDGIIFTNKCNKTDATDDTNCKGKLQCMCMYPYVRDDVTNSPGCMDRINAMRILCDSINDNREVYCSKNCSLSYCWSRTPGSCKTDYNSLNSCTNLGCQCKPYYYINSREPYGVNYYYPKERGRLDVTDKVCVRDSDCTLQDDPLQGLADLSHLFDIAFKEPPPT